MRSGTVALIMITASIVAACTNRNSAEQVSPVSAGSLPDLQVNYINNTLNPVCMGPDTHMVLIIRVVNTGKAAAPPFILSVNGTEIAHEALDADSSAYRVHPDPDNQIVNTDSPITVIVDSDNQIAESDETNNLATAFPRTLTPPPPCATSPVNSLAITPTPG